MTDHHGHDLSTAPDYALSASEWLDYGIARGWCSASFCGTHDSTDALTPDEAAAWEAGDDPCMPVIRLL